MDKSPLMKNTSLSDINTEILKLFRAHFGGFIKQP